MRQTYLLLAMRHRFSMDEQLLNELGETLWREMPISKAMAIETVSWDGSHLAMQMPLAPNRNHQSTAFAGSLNALCTAVGWGTVFLLLKSDGQYGNIVIRRSKIRYLRPVSDSTIVASGLHIDPEKLAYFFELLASKGKSKIDIGAVIADDQGAYVSFEGSYVVQRD